MDFRDIFDSFFGFDRNNEKPYKRNSGLDNDFNDFETEMNRDFEDIAKTFGQMFEIFNQFSIRDEINDSNRWQTLNTIESKSPRDLVLKSSDDINKYDNDFDQTVRRNGLDSILNENSRREPKGFESPIESKIMRKSYFYSSFDNNGVIY